MARKYRRPWWVGQRWEVETIAHSDSPSGRFKKGDWILIYSGATKKEAQEDARRWGQTTGQQTRVVPGAGHKTRRGF
jgi:hypothetical protein